MNVESRVWGKLLVVHKVLSQSFSVSYSTVCKLRKLDTTMELMLVLVARSQSVFQQQVEEFSNVTRFRVLVIKLVGFGW